MSEVGVRITIEYYCNIPVEDLEDWSIREYIENQVELNDLLCDYDIQIIP